ncbi:MAG TPA: OadG family protein [Clostridiales bacterium]|nr:OadG family protein [Clostridiales bacterium]
MMQILLFNNTAAIISTTLNERFSNAALNTIIGLLTVFSVLILITFIISTFKYIPMIMEKLSKDKEKDLSSKEVSTRDSELFEVEDNEYTNNEELVAVITAAIYASLSQSNEQIPVNGLVVRSIRKTNSKWARP